jgi:hypothetical protein
LYALGVSISQEGSPDWIRCRRGAVAERLVVELIGSRPAIVLREQKIALTKARWTRWTESRPKDALVDTAGGAFEVFECKRSPAALGGVDQTLINELGDIQETGEAEGRDTRTCIAWLVPYEAILRKLKYLDIRACLYYAARDDILALRDGPPESRIN